jgi:hypothetical protein
MRSKRDPEQKNLEIEICDSHLANTFGQASNTWNIPVFSKRKKRGQKWKSEFFFHGAHIQKWMTII